MQNWDHASAVVSDMASVPCTPTSSSSSSSSLSASFSSSQPPRNNVTAPVRRRYDSYVAVRGCEGDGGCWSARGASVAVAADEGDGSGEGWSWSRRGVVGASALALLATSLSLGSGPANAFSLGICKVGFSCFAVKQLVPPFCGSFLLLICHG